MGDEYTHAHAAALASQLPRESRCRRLANPENEWSDETWMLWNIEHNVNMLRWALVRAKDEEMPQPLPYPGQKRAQLARRVRFEKGVLAVEAAFGMMGG